MNLFKLASIPTLMQANEAQKQVDEARRMAQAMAIMTQVRVATLRYGLSISEYQQVSQSAAVDERLLGYARSAASARVESELEVIRNEARALLSEYQRHIAYANAQAAWGRIYNSLGYDVEPPPMTSSVAEVAAAIERSLAQWQKATFVSAASRETVLPAVAIAVTHADPTERVAIEQSLRLALARNGLRPVERREGEALPVGTMLLQARPALESPEEGLRRGTIAFQVVRRDGRTGGSTRYGAMLPATADARSLAALASAAVDASSVTLREWADEHAVPAPQLAVFFRD
jgi:hypothetical protein